MSRQLFRCQIKLGELPWRALVCLTALTVVGLTVISPRADVIELVNGQQLQGVIQEESSEALVLLVPGLNRMRLPRERIASIERSEVDANTLLMGNLHLEQGLLYLSAQHYTEALALDVAPDRIAEALLANPTALIIRLQSLPPMRFSRSATSSSTSSALSSATATCSSSRDVSAR